MPLRVRDLRERARATRSAVATPANMRFIVLGVGERRGGEEGEEGRDVGDGGSVRLRITYRSLTPNPDTAAATYADYIYIIITTRLFLKNIRVRKILIF